jgi:hypothetical protein
MRQFVHAPKKILHEQVECLLREPRRRLREPAAPTGEQLVDAPYPAERILGLPGRSRQEVREPLFSLAALGDAGETRIVFRSRGLHGERGAIETDSDSGTGGQPRCCACTESRGGHGTSTIGVCQNAAFFVFGSSTVTWQV